MHKISFTTQERVEVRVDPPDSSSGPVNETRRESAKITLDDVLHGAESGARN